MKLRDFLLTAGAILSLSACSSMPSGQNQMDAMQTDSMTDAPAAADATNSSDDSMQTDSMDSMDVPQTPDTSVSEAVSMYFENLPEDNHMITPEEVFQKMDLNENMVLIDVRAFDAYKGGHLEGAYNVPYGPEIVQSLELIPDDVPIYVNCYTGQLGSQVTAILNLAGKNAANIDGGWNNGISLADNAAAHTSQEQSGILEGSYPVSPALLTAASDYFAASAKSTYSSFNFPASDLLKSVKANDGAYTLLSVRDAASYQAGHIEGALNIPFDDAMSPQLSALPTDKPIVVYSQTGQISSQVMTILRFLGYESYTLSGGIDGDSRSWIGNGYPVVR